jgi:CMP-N,N'-diacetyllegionaminic acid synthase
MSESVCIIPARGGSRRIPRKNVLPLNGIPLLAYSIRAALGADVFTEVIVSSEDEEILKIAEEEGARIDHRPAHLATDTATKVQVIKEFLERPGHGEKYEYITALLPTCPFRTHKHVREAFELLKSEGTPEFLIGVTEYDFPIQLALTPVDDKRMHITFADGYKVTRSQDISKRYHPNGAMYMAKVKAFLEKGTFFNEEMLTYKMSAIRSFDIDYPYQFAIAEILSKNINDYE